jgi:hypothetical protein
MPTRRTAIPATCRRRAKPPRAQPAPAPARPAATAATSRGARVRRPARSALRLRPPFPASLCMHRRSRCALCPGARCQCPTVDPLLIAAKERGSSRQTLSSSLAVQLWVGSRTHSFYSFWVPGPFQSRKRFKGGSSLWALVQCICSGCLRWFNHRVVHSLASLRYARCPALAPSASYGRRVAA